MGKVIKKGLPIVGIAAITVLTAGSGSLVAGLALSIGKVGAIAAISAGFYALSFVSKALAPSLTPMSGAEFRAPIRSATPPKILPYGRVLISGVDRHVPGYGQ